MSDRCRYFRPVFLERVGSYLVAIDEIQPVALLFDDSGRVAGTVEWGWAAGPTKAVWRPRTIATSDRALWIDDGAEADVVRLDITEAATCDVQRVAALPGQNEARHRPYVLWRSHLTVPAVGGTWHTRSALGDSGVSWYASVQWRPNGSEAAVRECDLGFGSIHAAVAHGEDVVVAVRRAGKRPWAFRPPVDLLRIAPTGHVETVLAHDALDVSYYCRGPSPHAPTARSLVWDRLRHEMSSDRSDMPHASDIACTVRDWNADPVFELSFDHPARPGVRLVRRELLRTELGFRQSAGDMSVYLWEDLMFEFLPPANWAQHGVLYV